MTERTYTLREIADMTGVEKTKVWRTAKRLNVQPNAMNGRTLHYDERSKDQIIAELSKNNPNIDAKVSQRRMACDDSANDDKSAIDLVGILNAELAQKNKEIDELHRLLDQQQQLNLKAQKQLELSKPHHWWHFW